MSHAFAMPDCHHKVLDARLLRLTEATVLMLDSLPTLRERLRTDVSRWTNPRLREKWDRLPDLPWEVLRSRLLDRGEEGAALRQGAPLGAILAANERSRIMREFAHDA